MKDIFESILVLLMFVGALFAIYYFIAFLSKVSGSKIKHRNSLVADPEMFDFLNDEIKAKSKQVINKGKTIIDNLSKSKAKSSSKDEIGLKLWKLEKINAMKEANILSEQEYNKLKKEILDNVS